MGGEGKSPERSCDLSFSLEDVQALDKQKDMREDMRSKRAVSKSLHVHAYGYAAPSPASENIFLACALSLC